ncbi:YadA-like family protein [Acinetobacter bereziniae]|uniref:YadA-like family protein n=1 Tax=Acinetobacter bereziniae TaxID=106648 RepID=UPI0012506B52|nr:YadA-like family protein [Acinetobacter bereziniae]
MNKVYKLVWNTTSATWVVVSEIVKGNKKSTVNKVVKGSILLLFIVNSGAILAQDINESLNVNGSLTATGDVIANGVSLFNVDTDLNQTKNDLNTLDDQVNNTSTGLASKVSQLDFDSLNNQVNDSSTGLASKVSQSDFNNLNNQVNDVNTGLNTKASTTDLDSLKNQTWNIQSNGGAVTAVKSSDTINFVNGKNITVSNTGTDISISTIDNPEFETVKIGDASNNTILTSSANGLDLGGDKITNLANGSIAAGSTDAVTGGQVNDLLFQSGQGIKYFHTNSSLVDSQANGLNSLAIGPVAKSEGELSIAIGNLSNATGLNSIAVGNTANALNDYSIAFGKETGALGTHSTSIGNGGQARTLTPTYNVSNTQLIAINGIPVTAMGTDPSTITEINGVAVSAAQVNQFLTALQNGANISVGDKSVALGSSALAGGPSSIAIGDAALATGNQSNAIGDGANALGSNANAIGTSASAATNANAIGNSVSASGTSSVAIGNQTTSAGASSIALGDGAKSSVVNGISIGTAAGAGSTGSGTFDRNGHIAVGANAGQNISGNQSIAIGVGAGSNSTVNSTSSDYNIALGTEAGTNLSGNQNISIGFGSNKDRNSTIQSSVAIGAATFTESLGVAVGTRASVAQGGVALGYDSIVTGTSGVAIGLDSLAGQSDVALGSGSIAQNNSLGNGYITNVSGGVGGFNIVSVGNQNEQRRITNVADGSDLQDAVTVNQIKALQNDIIRVMGATDAKGNPATIGSNGTLPLIQVNVKDSSGNTSKLPTTIQDAFDLLGTGQIGGVVPDAVLYNSDKSVVNLVGTDGTIIRNVKGDENDLSSAVNFGQLKTAVAEAGPQYFSVNTTDINNKNNTGANGDNSLAIGPSASTSSLAAGSVALGSNVIVAREKSVAIGAGAGSVGVSSISIGDSSIATGTNNIAMGKSAESRGEDSIVIGNGSEADGTKSNYAVVVGSDAEVNSADQGIAIGRQALSQGDNATAIGYQSKANGAQSVALGRFATATAQGSMAYGDNAEASGINSTAIGTDADSTAQDSVALGSQAKSYAAKAIAIGQNAESAGENAIAFGVNSVSRAKDATAIGNNATSNGVNAIALGKQSNANALNSIALGTGTNALQEDAIAIGNSASVSAKGATVLGKSATASHENAVVLGNNSVSTAYVATTSTTINGKTYNFAGVPGTSSSVSVGDLGSERTIVNVAAGRINSTSTDAINGSQIYQTNQAIADLADTSLSFAGDTGTRVDRKLGEQLKLTGGATGVLTDDNLGVVSNGIDTLQLKLAKDVNLTAQGSLTVGTSKITDGQVQIIDSANNSNINTSTQSVLTSGANSNTTNASSLNLKNATNNILLSGTTGTLTGLTNKTLTESDFATVGRAATEEQLKLVNEVAENANKGWNLTTNKDGAGSTNIAASDTVDFSNSDSNFVLGHTGANVDLKLAEIVNVGGLPGGANISINGKNGTITGLTNTTFDPSNYLSGRAATEDQLATPLTFSGDNAGVNVDRKLGQRLSIVGGESVASNLTDNNIGVIADSTDNKLTIKLAKDIQLDSVNASGTVIDSKGLTFVNSSGGAVPNSPSVTVTGINAGTNKVTNVGAGDINDSSMDAINGSQIKQIIDQGFSISANADTAAKDIISLGENVDFSATDGNIKITNTGKNGINFALEPVVKIGPATGGNPITINGNTGTIIGLSNKTTAISDFATVGRAATEEQLKQMQTDINDAGFGLTAGDGSTVSKKLGETIEIVGADSNISTQVIAGKVQVELAKNIDLTSTGSLTVGKSKITDGKVELKDGNKSNTSTVDGSLVSDGSNTSTIGAGSINISNGLYQTRVDPTQIVVGGANPVIVNGSTGRVSGLSNTTWDANATYNQKQAATEEQLKQVSDVAQNANKGWNIKTDSILGTTQVKPGDTVDVGLATGENNLNVSTKNDANGTTTIDFSLNKDLNIDSVTAGTATDSTILNKDGLTVQDGDTQSVINSGTIIVKNSVNQLVLDANKGTLEGLTNKSISSSDFATVGRAATEEQLKQIQTGLNDAGFALTAQDGNTLSKKLGESVDVIGADSNISTKVADGKVQVELAKNIDLTSVGSLTIGKSKITDGKVELKDAAKSNTSTVDGTLVSDINNSSWIGAGSINLSNGIYQTQMGPTQVIVGGANPVTVNGAAGTIGGLTNKTFNPNNFVSGQAATEDQLKAVSDSIQTANQGWNLTTNGTNSHSVKSGDTVDFANKDGNINISNNASNVSVELAKDIQVDSVTTGNTVINNDGLTISGGPSVTKNGIDAAGNKVTNVTDGSIAQSSKDAVNGSQIHNIIGEGAFQGGDGNTITNIGGTGATNINDAISSINQKAGQHATVIAGQNMTVTETTNSSGGKEYKVATADDVKFNTVTSNTVTANTVKVGDVVIDQNGINAGNQKITNVAAGEVSSTSKDAVNGSQLNTSNQYITSSLGGGAKYENGQFTQPTYNVNHGTYHNVGDALGALNQADIDLGNKITNLGDRLEQVFYDTNGRIDDLEKRANAGNAQALATAGLPQAYIPGKSMMAISGGTYRGESGYAIGMSSISDNGRWVFKVSGSGNSRGDFGGTVGTGIQW